MAKDRFMVPLEKGDIVLVKLDTGEWLTGHIEKINEGGIITGDRAVTAGAVHVMCEVIMPFDPRSKVTPSIVKTAYQQPKEEPSKVLM